MAKNRFAQPLFGKIIYIYETHLTIDELHTVFDPKTFWIDVTGVDCEVGYVQKFVEGQGIVWVPPTTNVVPTLAELKARALELLKAERDAREESFLLYNGNVFDYDAISRERLDSARRGLQKNGGVETWTTAINTHVELTLEDLENIDEEARSRSRQLHFQYNKLKALVESCTSKEELDAINFDTDV